MKGTGMEVFIIAGANDMVKNDKNRNFEAKEKAVDYDRIFGGKLKSKTGSDFLQPPQPKTLNSAL